MFVDTSLMPAHASLLSRSQIEELRLLLEAASDESLASRAIVLTVANAVDGKLIQYTDKMDFDGVMGALKGRSHLRPIRNVLSKILDRLD